MAIKKGARRETGRGAGGLYLIGIYKLIEGVALIALGFGAVRMLHRDLATSVLHWVHALRVDPHNRYIHALLVRAFAVTPKQLEEFSVGTFLYAGLRLIEGVGLVMRKRWAEWLTAAATALFIPLEIYEMYRRLSWIRVGLFVVNVMIVVYLVAMIRRRR